MHALAVADIARAGPAYAIALRRGDARAIVQDVAPIVARIDA